MKKSFVILFLLLSVFGCVIKADAEPMRDEGVVSLNIYKTEEVDPDIATVTFAIETTAVTAQKAASENNILSAKVLNALKNIASDKKDIIKTSNYSIIPDYSYAKDSTRSIKSYTAYNSVIVETKNTENISKLIDAATASGANRTDNLTYSFETPDDICNKVYPELIKKLKEQAEEIAKAAGAEYDGIKRISAGCSSDAGYSPRFFAAKNVSAGAAVDEAVSFDSAQIEAGKIKIRVSLSSDFYIKQAGK